MPRGFTGQKCAYCETGVSGRQGDHVWARNFIPVEFRAHLPKVPCCEECNGLKAKLEAYLTSVLPFGSRTEYGQSELKRAEYRLLKNNRLKRSLQEGFTSRSNAIYDLEELSIPIVSEELEQYLIWVARGLFNFHFNSVIYHSHPQKCVFATEFGDETLSKTIFSLHGELRSADLGKGSLNYQSNSSIGPPLISIWRFSVLNGIKVSDDIDAVSKVFWVFFAPDEQIDRLNALCTP